jgi:hypothetical protein
LIHFWFFVWIWAIENILSPSWGLFGCFFISRLVTQVATTIPPHKKTSGSKSNEGSNYGTGHST